MHYADNAANGLGYQAEQKSALAQVKSRTISSAIGRIDDLNGRLRDLNGRLEGIADQIGGPRPVAGIGNEKCPDASGIVGQLNDSAERAHSQLNDIEELLATIGRALG